MSSSGGSKKRPFKWRKWNNILHRDIGYLAVALTVIYAISGIAVNHRNDWNPNYRFERVVEHFAPFEPTSKEEVAGKLVQLLDLPGPPKDSFRSSPEQIELFYEGWSVQADVSAGAALIERPRERWFLRDFNYLHLNDPAGLWTWIADLYAVMLLFLAVSGTLVIKGKKGLTGRGKWLIGAGLVVPVVFLILARYL